MAGNEKLHIAKEKRNSEYYTEYSTISNEISKIRSLFRGKSVYCNCDDPSWSNFWRYFHNNFASLGLTRLVSTHYQHGSEPSYALIYEGKKKDSKNLNLMIKREDMELLDEFCEKTGLTKTSAVEKAIEYYVKKTETIADVIRNNDEK